MPYLSPPSPPLLLLIVLSCACLCPFAPASPFLFYFPGNEKLGAVDATQAQSLAQKYGVQGYPTIKTFPAGPKKAPQDYNGPREAAGIVDYATGVRAGLAPLVTAWFGVALCGDRGGRCWFCHLLEQAVRARRVGVPGIVYDAIAAGGPRGYGIWRSSSCVPYVVRMRREN